MPQKPLFDSQALCARAMQTLEAWGAPFDPKSYELAYVYEEGSNAALNGAVNAATKDGRKISLEEVARLRQRYLPLEGVAERVDSVGARLGDEVDQVVGMIEAAVGMSGNFRDALRGSRERLNLALDRETLRNIIEAVLASAREVQRENRLLSSSLQQSQDDILKLQDDLLAIQHENLRDALTGVANRKHLDKFLDQEVAHAGRTRRPMSLLLADVDHFKTFNDCFGHLTGDCVLRMIAETLHKHLQGTDLVARYGGEEFAIVLPNTALEQACLVAEKLRRAVMANELVKRSTGERLGRVTISVGVSTCYAGEGAQALLEAADVCLYEAKKSGRNCVVSERDLETLDLNRRRAG